MHKSRESINEQQRQTLNIGKKPEPQYWPDNVYPKIRFETGEECWIRCEFGDFLYLIFADLTGGARRKCDLPEYKIIAEPRK